MANYKIRFNLGKGVNYKKWQVVGSDGRKKHYDPELVSLFLVNAKLTNRKKTAQKIKDGAHKTVCAWVEAEKIIVVREKPYLTPHHSEQLSYNPRVTPNWVDMEGNNCDNNIYNLVISNKNKLYNIPIQ